MKRMAMCLVLMCLMASSFAIPLAEIEGTWDIMVDTPIGLKKGQVVTLWDEQGKLTGSLTLFDKTSSFDTASFDGDVFFFSGKMKISFIKVAYEAQGAFEDDAVLAVARTKFGDMTIIGSRHKPSGK